MLIYVLKRFHLVSLVQQFVNDYLHLLKLLGHNFFLSDVERKLNLIFTLHIALIVNTSTISRELCQCLK